MAAVEEAVTPGVEAKASVTPPIMLSLHHKNEVREMQLEKSEAQMVYQRCRADLANANLAVVQADHKFEKLVLTLAAAYELDVKEVVLELSEATWIARNTNLRKNGGH